MTLASAPVARPPFPPTETMLTLMRHTHTHQVMVAGPGGVLQERKVVEVSTRPGEGGGGRGPRKRAAFYRLQSTDTPSRKKVG